MCDVLTPVSDGCQTHMAQPMTENNGNDRRRDINGRIDTLGTGTNGVSGRRASNRIGNRHSKQRDEEEEHDQKAVEASLAEEEDDEKEADAAASADEDEDDRDAEAEPVATESDGQVGDDAEFDADEDKETDDEADAELEIRAEDFDNRSTLEVEIDPFVRAYAARRAAEGGDESLDEYIVGSVKGYLAGLLGGEVSSPGTLEREVAVESDQLMGGLLETIAEEDESPADVVITAIAEAYEVPVDEETLVVAGLRDHEALLNGVVANSSNDLGDTSEVVQAAVETRLIEEPA